jgi:hypothetical protein
MKPPKIGKQPPVITEKKTAMNTNTGLFHFESLPKNPSFSAFSLIAWISSSLFLS